VSPARRAHAASPASPASGFARRLTRLDLVLIGAGGAIGSGIFRTPSQVAAAAGSPAWTLAAWALGGAVTLAGALTFAELGDAMPRAGGQYVWLSETYGGLVGFLHGWAYFTVVATGAIAALALVFAEYAGVFVPLGPIGTKAVALGALALLAVVNVVGVRVAAVVGDALTIAKLAALAGIVAVGVWKGVGVGAGVGAGAGAGAGAGVGAGAGAGAVMGMGAAMIGVLWSYGGWQHASFAAGEAKDARRDVPWAMVAATGIVTLAYVLANVAYLRLLPMATLTSSTHVASDAVEAGVGRAGGAVVAAAIATSALGTAGIFTLTTPRLYWAMAERGLFFRGVADLHPRWRTPVRAILLQTAWAAVLVLAWGTFESLVSYVLFVDWIFFGLTGAAVFVLRRRHGPPAGYRVPGYPLVPLAFVATSAWFVASTLVAQPAQAIAGAMLLGAGCFIHRVWKRGAA
jgi:APA family basic amino acid/polyamine antiporter